MVATKLKCITKMCIFLIAENKPYKAATKAEDKLHATCTQLQLISNITQDHCVLFARSLDNANTISYDVTNAECSIQQCQQSGITATVNLASEAVILFEAAFYPKCKYGIIRYTSKIR